MTEKAYEKLMKIKLKTALLYPLILLTIGTLTLLALNGYFRTLDTAESLSQSTLKQALNQTSQSVTEKVDHIHKNLALLSETLTMQPQHYPLDEMADKLNRLSTALNHPLFLTFPNHSRIEVEHKPQKKTVMISSEGETFKTYYTQQNQKLANTAIAKSQDLPSSFQTPNWASLFDKVPQNNALIEFKDRAWFHHHLNRDGYHFIISTYLSNNELIALLQNTSESFPYTQIFLTTNTQLLLQTNAHQPMNQIEFDTLLNEDSYTLLQHSLNLKGTKDWSLHMSIPKWRMSEALNRSLTDTLIQTLLVMIGIMLFIILLTHRLTRPLKLLTDKAQKLKHQRLEEIKADQYTIDEYRQFEDVIFSLKRRYQAINKYTPVPLIEKLNQSNLNIQIEGDRKPLNLISININQFTRLTKDLSPQQLVHYLSLYQTAIYDILTDKKAIVDQNNGDHIMAYWGAPVANDNDPIFACQAALAINAALDALNTQLIEENYPTFQHRISIVSGETVVGNFGSSERMVYSVIGSKVDEVQFVNQLNKRYATDIIICDKTYQDVQEAFFMRKLDRIDLPTGEKNQTYYELICHANDPTVHQKIAFVQQYENALNTKIMKDYDKAEEDFMALMTQFPNDEASIYQMGLLFQIKQNENR